MNPNMSEFKNKNLEKAYSVIESRHSIYIGTYIYLELKKGF